MRINILTFILIIFSLVSYGQTKGENSIGLDADYLYPNLDDNQIRDFNYGLTLHFSKRIENVKWSIGVGYSTLNLHYGKFTSGNTKENLNKEAYKAQYLNIPILLSLNNNSNKRFNIKPFGGVIINKVLKYDRIRYFSNTPPEYVKGIEVGKSEGFTCRAGISISKPISQKINLNTALFVDYKFSSNMITQDGRFDMPDNKITFGIKMGLDYLL